MYVLLLVVLAGCAPKVPYDATEKILLGGVIGGQILDGASTLQKLNDGCIEVNPILGKNPNDGTVVATKVVAGAFIWQVSNLIDSHKWRKAWLVFGGVVGVGAGVHNYSVSCD